MAVQLPKNVLFPKVAIDGDYTYNGLAFATNKDADEIFMVLSAPTDRVVIIILSFEDLRRLLELTEQ